MFNNVTRACFYQLRQLRFMRRCLPENTVKMLLHAFISSRVDYCNSVLYGATSGVLCKLQAVLHAAARLFSGLRRFDHITPVLRDELHWLPVKQRIVYKLALLVYKCLHGSAPSYLTEHCIVLTATSLHHHLRSSTRDELHLRRMRTHLFGPRSFRSSGPTVWNALPVSFRDASLTLEQFKKCLKHQLFSVVYDT